MPRGRVLDVGCGHGLFSATLAAEPGTTVRGLDHDPRKLAVAEQCVRGPNVSFGGGALSDEPVGAYDAVLIIDVLYLVPRAAWRDFLADAAARLAPGGVLVLKEVGLRPRWKATKMAAQEWVMARLLGRTKGETLAFADAETLADLVRALGLEVEVHDLSAGYTTPHVLVRGRRPQASAP